MLGFQFRDQILGPVRDEFENIYTTLRALWTREHKDDGTHKDVTADSVTVQGSKIGTVTDVAYDAARFTSNINSWKVDAVDFEYLRFTRIGQIVTIWFGVSGTSFPGGAVNSLKILMPELHMLPAVFDDGGGLHYGSYLGGMARYSDSSGDGYCEVRAQEAPLAGTPSMNIFMQKAPAATFDGVSCDFHGFITFAVQANNAPTNYAIA